MRKEKHPTPLLDLKDTHKVFWWHTECKHDIVYQKTQKEKRRGKKSANLQQHWSCGQRPLRGWRPRYCSHWYVHKWSDPLLKDGKICRLASVSSQVVSVLGKWGELKLKTLKYMQNVGARSSSRLGSDSEGWRQKSHQVGQIYPQMNNRFNENFKIIPL